MLLKDARIGDIVFNQADRSLWGLRHLNGYVSLVRIPYPYTEWNLVYAWPYGEVAYELDISADGQLLSASLGEIDGRQFLRVFATADLLEEKAEPAAEYEFTPAAPEGFVFSADSKYLFGSSFITGVSNIFRFEKETNELEAVSNAETGLFRPIPQRDGSLLVAEYTGQGFVPTYIDPVPLEDVSAITLLGARGCQASSGRRRLECCLYTRRGRPRRTDHEQRQIPPLSRVGLRLRLPGARGIPGH